MTAGSSRRRHHLVGCGTGAPSRPSCDARRSAPDEWQLVAVTVRLLDVARDGDVWRAEATLGAAGDLPIVGLSGSGTSADGLEPGRSARVVGIVKRAHPSASDQRFAIAPRSPR